MNFSSKSEKLIINDKNEQRPVTETVREQFFNRTDNWHFPVGLKKLLINDEDEPRDCARDIFSNRAGILILQ